MADTTPNPTDPTPPTPKKTHPTPNPVDKRSLDDIKRGEDVADGALDAVWTAALTDEGIAATAPGDLSKLCAEARTLGGQLVTATQIKESATQTELGAFKPLMVALRGIQDRAKRKFAGDAANQKAYFIGLETFGDNRTTLEQDAQTIIDRATADNLPGMTPQKLSDAASALSAWKLADAAQTVAVNAHATLQTQFEAKVAAINSARREIQIAGNTAKSFTDPANAAARRLLKLPPNTPYNPGLGAPPA